MKDKVIWYRRHDSDFYVPEQADGKVRRTRLMNATEAPVTIRNILLVWTAGGSCFIDLRISPFQWTAFTKTCAEFFHNNSSLVKYTDFRNEVSITWTDYSFKTFLAMLHYMDTQNSLIEFPEILIDELTNIHLFTQDENRCLHKKHLLFLWLPTPSKENTIMTLFMNHEATKSAAKLEKNLKKALVSGEDPNQKNILGQTPLGIVACKMAGLEVADTLVFLLLCYGANPWSCANLLSSYSAIEEAKHSGVKSLAVFESWLKSPVYIRKNSGIYVEGIDMIPTKKALHTTISLNNNFILWSELKAVSDLKMEEKMALFPLYAHPFNADDGNILASFEHAFSPTAGKLIDIIRNQDAKIIGANVFILGASEKVILVYIDLSFLHPDYRGMGIMPLIDFRLSFALQSLYGEHQVLTLFLSASYHAMRKVENTVFFPKYQAENMVDYVKSAFSEVYNNPLQWKKTPDGIYWTVKEDHQVSVTPVAQKRQALLELFYYTQLCGSENSYVPVMVPTGLQMLQNIHNLLASRQVNFLKHYRELAEVLSETQILSDINPVFDNKKPSNLIYDSREIFWNKKRLPVAESIIRDNFLQPEMRHKMNPKL